VRSTKHKAPRYVIFSTLLLPRPSWGPNIFLSTLSLNNFNRCYFLNVIDQISHPYKTTGKFIILYILICIFLVIKLDDKRCKELFQILKYTVWTKCRD